MLLLLRALLVLGLAPLLRATKRERGVSVKLGCGTGRKEKTLRLVLDPSVIPQINSQTSSNIANMSLSPWTYNNSFVASRFPERISQAKCLTSGCLSLPDGGQDVSLEARPIQYQALVLHRVQRQKQTHKNRRQPEKKKKKKRYDFRLGMELITVGCTCVKPGVVPQQ